MTKTESTLADQTQARVPIVAIGASAGGIEALEALFRAMPATVGAGFVVITHLNPERESMLPSILERFAPWPVAVAEDGVAIEADHVYVMPANVRMTIANGRLGLEHPTSVYRQAQPIDLFFSMLARDRREFAAGIILSGGNSDGTLGAKAIKEHGGLTLAQVADGMPLMHPNMPEAAIASGMIDLAIPAREMPDRLVAFVDSLRAPLDNVSADETRRLEERSADVFNLLTKQTGHDFSGYKTKTFARRLRRRMQLHQIGGVDAYVARLREDANEVAALFRDLLISVTNFFRDAEAFEVLGGVVIPEIFKDRAPTDTVRIWVPGCATGEEVYSIAILACEHMETTEDCPNVQIFATDIDERSLDTARTGRYPEPLMEGVSKERRRRFFTREGSSYVVSKQARALCIFSPHSLIRDPPFSRMDLVSCRNLLIYLGANLQTQVLPLFHYSLKPQGYLFLGSSENIGQYTDLFTAIDKKERVFKAKVTAAPQRGIPVLRKLTGKIGSARMTRTTSSSTTLRRDIESQVVDRFAPAHVVIDAEGDVVFYSSHTGKYLEAAVGAPSRQLLGMARKGLRLELRGVIAEAVSGKCRAARENIALEVDADHFQLVKVVVEPLDITGEGPLFIVLFADSGPKLDQAQATARTHSQNGDAVTALERELGDTRERLHSMMEEYETALEELTSSNEELVSVNEELQSTNEELEASKEELQSLNEELNTVNTELNHRVDELNQSNDDLSNLFESSKIATIFLSRDLTIRNFTPLAGAIFDLVPSDRGRALTTFSSRLDYPRFQDDLARTIKTGEMIETQVAHQDGRRRFLVRMQPYRNAAGVHEGATVTFVDVSSLAKA